MRDFFDTSVLVAAFWGGHAQHPASLRRFAVASPDQSACGIHTLAEVYASMSALPVKPPIPPEQAYLFVEEVRKRLTTVSLSGGEYLATIQEGFGTGLGRRPDLRCAVVAVRGKLPRPKHLHPESQTFPDNCSQPRTPPAHSLTPGFPLRGAGTPLKKAAGSRQKAEGSDSLWRVRPVRHFLE